METVIYESIDNIGPANEIIQFTRTQESHDIIPDFLIIVISFICYVRTSKFGLIGFQVEGARQWPPYQMKSKLVKQKNCSYQTMYQAIKDICFNELNLDPYHYHYH